MDFCSYRTEAAGDAAKHAKKTAEHVAEQAKKTAENVAEQASSRYSLYFFKGKLYLFHLEQGEKLKRQASDAGEKVKSAAKDAKKQVEKRTEGLGDKLYNILIDVKNSLLGKFKF
jgi:cell division septum initiation protein DivIVA